MFQEVGVKTRPPLLARVRTNREDPVDELLERVGLDYSWENVRGLVKHIHEDDSLEHGQRRALLRHITDRYLDIICRDAVASDYSTLKAEAILLSEMTRHSFVHMALRLRKIRNEELYRQDGYPDFKSFLDGEICLSRSTVYNYIDIVTFFSVQPVGHEPEVEYSKLLPVIPLLKADNPDIPKEELKAEFYERARTCSREEMKRLALSYRTRYGLTRRGVTNLDRLVAKVRRQLPPSLDNREKRVVRDLIGYLTRLVDP